MCLRPVAKKIGGREDKINLVFLVHADIDVDTGTDIAHNLHFHSRSLSAVP